MQSRDRVVILRIVRLHSNLAIEQAISRPHNYGAQSQDSENAQRNFKFTQILKLQGTYALHCGTIERLNNFKNFKTQNIFISRSTVYYELVKPRYFQQRSKILGGHN